MAEIVKIVGIEIITILANVLVRQTNKEIAMIITIVGSILIIFLTVNVLKDLFSGFYQIFQKTKLDSTLLAPLLKVVGIGYLAEFGANLCLDAGVNSIADKILFSAKILILVIALPIITSVVDLVVAIL